MIVLETPQLILRHFTWNDVDDLAKIYADPVVMKFFPKTLTYAETQQQMERFITGYEQQGLGLWATIHKADRQLIGRCGLIQQEVDEQLEMEIGYLLAKEYWGQGLGTEAARAIRDYGFDQLGYTRLISLIDPNNIASQKVATKNGLTYEKDTYKWEKTLRVYAIHQ